MRSMTTNHVESEVGVLRRVLLHRPDLELRRLTPTNCRDLLFDDVLWVRRARQEHDAFADTLRDQDVEVLDVGHLLAETIKDDRARGWLLDRAVTEHELGRDLAAVVRDFLESADPTTAASHLIGGLTASELPTGSVGGLRLEVGGPHGLPAPAPAEPPLRPGHVVLGVLRRLPEPDGHARPTAGDGEPRGDLPVPPRPSDLKRCGPSTAGSTRTGEAPRSKAATSW